MKKRASILLIVPAFGLLLAGCDAKEGSYKAAKSAKKHWVHGVALLEKWFGSEEEEKKDETKKTEAGVVYKISYRA